MKEYCKALRKNRRVCVVGVTALRDELPVCRRHTLAYGLYYGATLDECTACHGMGYVFQKPSA